MAFLILIKSYQKQMRVLFFRMMRDCEIKKGLEYKDAYFALCAQHSVADNRVADMRLGFAY